MYRSLLITTCFCASVSTTPCLSQSHDHMARPLASRNPFMPAETAPTHRPLTTIPPLERYPITSLTLTAIITNAHGERYASVENPQGIGYKVEKGSRLGNAGAQVVEISSRGLVVEEQGPQGPSTREILLRVER